MSRSLLFFIVIVCVILSSSSDFAQQALESEKPNGDRRWNFAAVYAPKMEYPIEARQRGWVGSGLILLEIDSATGIVKSAKVIKSTGHKILDDAALRSYQRWRFIRGSSVSKVKLPFEFTDQPIRFTQ